MSGNIFPCTVIAIVLLPSVLLRAANADRSADEQELTKIENDWGESYIKRDPSFAERIATDDFIFVGADGNIVEKSNYVRGIKGNTVLKQFKIDDLKIRFYGDTAIVIGRATITSKWVLATSRAVSASSGRLNTTTPPNAEIGSVSNARR